MSARNVFSGNSALSYFPLRFYTLIELIVVSAIIVILLSLLLTVLETAKTIVKDKVCMENLSNIGALSYEYSCDNKGFFPRQSADSGGMLTVSWDDNLSLYDGRHLSDVDKSTGFLYYYPEDDPDYETLGKSYINEDHSLYQCPMDEPPVTYHAGVNTSPKQPRRIRRTYNPNSVTTYDGSKKTWGPAMSEYVTLVGISKGSVSRNIVSVEDPGGTIAFAEQVTRFNSMGAASEGAYNWTCNGVGAPAEVFCNWRNLPGTGEPIFKKGIGGILEYHGQTEYTANYLFCDGRVEMLEAQETVNPADHVWALNPGASNGMWTAKAGD